MWMWFFSLKISYCTNSIPFPIMHVAITFAVWSMTAKLVWISTSFFTVSRIGFFLTVDLSNLSIWFFFLPLLSGELSPLHLKEALYGFSWAYLNCQRHYSCALGPYLSKIRVTWTQALQCVDSWFDNQMATKWPAGKPGEFDENSALFQPLFKIILLFLLLINRKNKNYLFQKHSYNSEVYKLISESIPYLTPFLLCLTDKSILISAKHFTKFMTFLNVSWIGL